MCKDNVLFLERQRKLHKKRLFVHKTGNNYRGCIIEKSIHPLSEDTASYADEGASVADGQGIVVAHAHGDFLEFGFVCKECLLYFAEESV